MDPELKNLLEENLKLNRENNAILLKLRKSQKLAMTYRIIYWIIILGISFGAYYFVQPYINTVFNYYGSVAGTTENISKNIPDLKHIQDLFNQVKN